MHWANIILGACAVITLLGAGTAIAWRKTRKRLSSWTSFLDQWHGSPEKRGAAGMLIEEARPGVMERITAVEQQITGFSDRFEESIGRLNNDTAILRGQVAEVREQLRPNGGTSVYDKVTGTARKVDQVAAVVMEGKQ